MPTTIGRIDDARTIGTLAVLLTAGALAFANFVAEGDHGGPGPYAVTLGGCLLVALLLFGRVVPRASDPAKAGAWIAALAVVTLPVFWSGLPIVLGCAAIAAGVRSATTTGTMVAAVGALAATATTVVCVIG
jgi:hypothetical protein